ncbi:MAG: PDZ domain-containing protein [Fimbriimonas sp.]
MTALTSLVALATVAPQASTGGGTVEVPFRIGETAIIVDSVVNGRNVSLMFDTGFSGSVIVDNTINLGKPTGTMSLRDFVRTQEAPTVKIQTLKLGAKSIDPKPETMTAVLAPPGDWSFAFNTHCDGLMGFQVIKHEVTEINFEKNRFIFHPKSLDITKRKPDGKRTFLAKLLPAGHDSLEMSVVAPSGKSLTMSLDTGNSFYGTTYTDSLERVGLWDGRKPKFMSQSAVASGNVDTWHAKMPAMTIYGVPVPSSVFDIIDLPSSSADADGTIGFQFLKNFNIIIDYERRRVWLENFTGKVSNEQVGEAGLFAGYSPYTKKIQVFRVTPEGPAEKAGIKEGDELLSIDGLDLTRQGYRQLRAMFEGPVGSKVKIAASRGGQLKRFEVERQPLLNEVVMPEK